jgi:SIR2-like domain
MTVSVHNPDQYMASLRQIVGQGRKRLGFLIGAGVPAGLRSAAGLGPLIPVAADLTKCVLEALSKTYGATLDSIIKELPNPNIENILSRVRSLAGVIGIAKIHGQDGKGYETLASAICEEIGTIVNQKLPPGTSTYTERQHAVEIFTTNYDLLFEQALERAKVPYFDGFAGGNAPFFDPSSVASNDLPPRWVRLWKLHGSVCWDSNEHGEVVRIPGSKSTHLVFPEHLKYDQTQKAPYSALFDRLRAFLMTQDTLLIVSGCSFADAHVSARLDECLTANPSASVFAFQFRPLAEESLACGISKRRPNMSVYAPDKAMINGVEAPWVPGEPPTRDWGPIRAGYWGIGSGAAEPGFLLGSSKHLATFLASSRAQQTFALSALTASGSGTTV